jgi:hypothetical protein
MCTVLVPPGDNPIAVNKYIISVTLDGHRYSTYLLFLSYFNQDGNVRTGVSKSTDTEFH